MDLQLQMPTEAQIKDKIAQELLKLDLKCAVLENVKKRFDVENIEIPYPYRTIVMKKNKEVEL
jgi:small-conductance mechanosensitive channel